MPLICQASIIRLVSILGRFLEAPVRATFRWCNRPSSSSSSIQDRQSARPDRSGRRTFHRRRGDRIGAVFAALHMSPFSTKRRTAASHQFGRYREAQRTCRERRKRVDLTKMPSRPGEFHLEPLTDPDLTLSRHPARATARRLPPSVENWSSSCCQLARPASCAHHRLR